MGVETAPLTGSPLSDRSRPWSGVRLSKRGSTLLFFVLVSVQMVIYDYPSILFRRPQGYHAWRQSDCLSMARNYMVTDLPPWEGQMHYLSDAGSGRAMSEMPALPYLIGHLWRITGQNEALYRGVLLTLSLIGLYALFLTTRLLLDDGFLAALVPALLFTSPMVAYYANNFLSNGAALALALMGWHAVARSIIDRSRGWAVGAVVLFTIAGLLKVTATLSLLAIFILLVLQHTPWRSMFLGGWRFKKDGLLLLSCASAFAIIGAWYSYARVYNAGQSQGIFLIGTMPYWEADRSMIREVWSGLTFHAEHSYLRPFFYPVLGGALLVSLMRAERVPRALWTLLGLLIMGTLSICALFFEALRDHDYYTLDQVILVPLVIIISLLALAKSSRPITATWPFQLIVLALLVHGTDFARRRVGDRYKGWMNHEYKEQHEPLGRMADTLIHLGVRPDARVVCVPDISFNCSLYLLDRQGWTDFGGLISGDPAQMRRCIGMGARFLLTTSDSVLIKPGIRPFLSRPLGNFENVRVFSLEPGD
jgi:uncharacterized membrane protein